MNTVLTDMLRRSWHVIAFAIAALLSSHAASAQSISPSAGMKCGAGELFTVSWDKTRFTGDVEISLWDGRANTWLTVAQSVPAARGLWEWNIPADLRGDMFRLRVRSLSSDTRYLFSDGYFSVVAGRKAAAVEGASNGASIAGRSVSIGPNPADDVIAVSFSEKVPVSLILTDIPGRELRVLEPESSGQNELRVDVADLPAGGYVLKLVFADGTGESRRIDIVR